MICTIPKDTKRRHWFCSYIHFSFFILVFKLSILLVFFRFRILSFVTSSLPLFLSLLIFHALSLSPLFHPPLHFRLHCTHTHTHMQFRSCSCSGFVSALLARSFVFFFLTVGFSDKLDRRMSYMPACVVSTTPHPRYAENHKKPTNQPTSQPGPISLPTFLPTNHPTISNADSIIYCP